MTVRAWIFLFGKPAWEIDELEGGEVTQELIEQIRKMGDEIRQNLIWVAEVLTKLLKLGWSGSGGLYDVMLYKDVTLKEAERELAELNINTEQLNLEEEEDEDDDEDLEEELAEDT